MVDLELLPVQYLSIRFVALLMAFRFPQEPSVRVSDVFFRTIAGLFGGGFGSLVLLTGVLVSGSVASLSLTTVVEEGVVHPLFIFVTLMIIYLALLISSLASLTFFYYCDRDRYAFHLSSLTHAFCLVTLMYVVSTPLSLVLALKSFESLSIIALIMMGLSVVFSVIAMEVVANHKHLLLTLYSSTISMFTFLLMMLGLYFVLGTTSYLLVVALPVCWATFGFWQVAFEMTYQWIYETYGTDFLNASTRVGSDYMKEQRMKK